MLKSQNNPLIDGAGLGASGQRVDAWLRGQFPQLRRRHIEEALEMGLVTHPKGAKLRKGDRVGVGDARPNSEKLLSHLQSLRQGASIPGVQVVHETSEEWVLDKPAGVHCVPLSLADTSTLTHWAFAQSPQLRDAFPDAQPELTPHRLDYGTSGLVIVAKTSDSFAKWRALFHEKKVLKQYIARCWGSPAEERFSIEGFAAHHVGDSSRMVFLEDEFSEIRFRGDLRHSHSDVEVITRSDSGDQFWCRVTCHTGVTHQVRLHLASLGLPLVGDSLYDPDYTARPEPHPTFHQLRAVALSVADWGTINLPVDSELQFS